MDDPLTRPRVLLFDVTETLLDIEPLQETVTDVLVDDDAPKLGFTTMLQYSLVMTVGGRHASYGDMGAAVRPPEVCPQG